MDIRQLLGGKNVKAKIIINNLFNDGSSYTKIIIACEVAIGKVCKGDYIALGNDKRIEILEVIATDGYSEINLLIDKSGIEGYTGFYKVIGKKLEVV